MEIHHVLFTASKKHYTLPPVPQRRRPAPGVFSEPILGPPKANLRHRNVKMNVKKSDTEWNTAAN
jgi:hypothetical protein